MSLREVVEAALPHYSLLFTALAPLSPRDGHVSLQEYMAFMISRETENVKSSEEIESAFRALSSEGKPYVTKEELYQVWAPAPALALGRGVRGRAESTVADPTLEAPPAGYRCCMLTYMNLSLGQSPVSVPRTGFGLWALTFLKSIQPRLRVAHGCHLPLQNLTREQADYCVSHMKPYVDGKGRELPTAFDYVEFTRSLFVN